MEKVLRQSKKFILGFCECGCGFKIAIWRHYNLLRRFRHPHSIKFLHESGENASHWRKGTAKMKSGYLVGNKKRYVHRLVWEEHHKACLLTWAHVHHKNKIKDDNRIENLQAVMNNKHLSLHRKDMSDRVCLSCGSKNTYRDKKGWLYWWRHPITKQEWFCKKCVRRIKYKLGMKS